MTILARLLKRRRLRRSTRLLESLAVAARVPRTPPPLGVSNDEIVAAMVAEIDQRLYARIMGIPDEGRDDRWDRTIAELWRDPDGAA